MDGALEQALMRLNVLQCEMITMGCCKNGFTFSDGRAFYCSCDKGIARLRAPRRQPSTMEESVKKWRHVYEALARAEREERKVIT